MQKTANERVQRRAVSILIGKTQRVVGMGSSNQPGLKGHGVPEGMRSNLGANWSQDFIGGGGEHTRWRDWRVPRLRSKKEPGMGEEARGILEHGRERHVVEDTKEWEVMESL